MKILSLTIRAWRNLRGVVLDIPTDSTLVCLVGENGTGKSNVLELASAIAHMIGISSGIQMSRGNPLDETCDIEAKLKITDSPQTFFPEAKWRELGAEGQKWDGTIWFTAKREGQGQLEREFRAGAVPDAHAAQVAGEIVNELSPRGDIHHLYLDSDRSYPPVNMHMMHFAEALQREWETRDWKKNRAFLPTRDLYDDWIKYFLAQENQHATRHVEAIRLARQNKTPSPEFEDPFVSFKESVERVLPHLKFQGTDMTKKTIVFDSVGAPLAFTQLSGGEREIAFLIGQIERFKLRTGLLFLDEPELHLNPDLIRTWVAFLRDTIQDGQVWISTHSIEAVEVTGPASTFVLERDATNRLVNCARSLKDRPVNSVLSAALGSPGFAIINLRFAFVEGERSLKERERFHNLCGNAPENRFIEAGGCKEVIRKVQAVSELAVETDQQLHVGGIIDRDFRPLDFIREITSTTKLFVLPCHEVENLFLHPETIRKLLERLGVNPDEAESIIRDAADRFAGAWLQQRAYARGKLLLEASKSVREVAWSTDWAHLSENPGSFFAALVAKQALPEELKGVLELQLADAFKRYDRLRGEGDLWKYCMGKETVEFVAKALGFASAEAFERNVLHLWKANDVATPSEVVALREYVRSL